YLGIADFYNGEWSVWTATFTVNDARPGDPRPEGPARLLCLVRRALERLRDFASSLISDIPRADQSGGHVRLTLTPEPRVLPRSPSHDEPRRPSDATR